MRTGGVGSGASDLSALGLSIDFFGDPIPHLRASEGEIREFMTPISLRDILKLSWNDYGEKGENSSQGPMNFRGNVLEALLGFCHERSIDVLGGYHAGRQHKPEQASSSSGKR